MESGAQILDAILLGRMDGLSEETIFLYSRTGLMHLFSASGFHMGVVLGLSRLLGRPACRLPSPWSRYLRFVLALLFMTFFGSQTGWGSPMVRAFAFSLLLETAKLLQLKPSNLRVFLFSLLASWLFGRGSSLSFLLSACGMAGVLWGGKGWRALLAPWLFTLPLVVWNFGLFSPLAPIWNLAVGGAVALLLPLALTDLFLSAIGLPWHGFRSLAAFGLGLVHEGLVRAESWIGLAYWVKPFPFFILSLLLFLAWERRRLRFLFAFTPVFLFLPQPKLALLNVGQGDAIFLRLTSGESLLVDGGPPYRKGAPVNHSLEQLAVDRLDYLLLTHPDRDHLGGLPSLILRHRAGTLWLRSSQLSDKRLLPLLEAAERASLPVRFLEQSEPAGLHCWLPPFSGNDSSPLCLAHLLRGSSIWLTGDAGFRAENWLLQNRTIPRGDYLKVGHHGSHYSSSPEFLRATGARAALISVGRKNRYGHPTEATISRLEEAGMEIHRTDEERTVEFYR